MTFLAALPSATTISRGGAIASGRSLLAAFMASTFQPTANLHPDPKAGMGTIMSPQFFGPTGFRIGIRCKHQSQPFHLPGASSDPKVRLGGFL